jgi:hypothetical protein
MVDLLLAEGADINRRSHWWAGGFGVLAQHLVRDRQEVVRYLVGRGCRTDLLMASALGDLELVRRHLDADPASIRMTVSPEYFPMQDARAGGSIYIWTLGANKMAHSIAREFGHEDVVRL